MINKFLIIFVCLFAFISCGDEPSGTGGGGVNPGPEPGDDPVFVKVKVLEYCPAPGQFVNEIPEYEEGDTYGDMLRKAEDYVNDQIPVTLGSLGGYVVLKLESPISNIAGEYDFRVLGNAFYGAGSTETNRGGSAEPGIIYVMSDDNGNGLPDDTWYEIMGSVPSGQIKTENITYQRPTQEETGEVIDGYITNKNYIRWDTGSETGYLMKITEHVQSYYPLWKSDAEISFGDVRRLPDNTVYNTEIQQYFLKAWEYGYADNHPNNVDGSKIQIDWAVDASGKKVELAKIDFIKVVSATLKFNGLMGETSTEVSGIQSFN